MNVELMEQARRGKEIPRDTLARLVGVSPSTYDRWVAGEREPRARQLGQLARQLGLTADDLLDPEPDPGQAVQVAS